jgi:peptidoglycan/LPS O-acetylase OafA/YrhL
MSASSLSFRTAVVLGLLGIVMGIIMAASHDHSVMPAHAHLNLLGWVSLFLFGIYYRFHPSIDSSRLALTQVVVWILGTVVLTIGVVALYLGKPQAEPMAVVGSLLILADMALFAVLVFRGADTVEKATRFNPAE